MEKVVAAKRGTKVVVNAGVSQTRAAADGGRPGNGKKPRRPTTSSTAKLSSPAAKTSFLTAVKKRPKLPLDDLEVQTRTIATEASCPPEIDPVEFRRRLTQWYSVAARALPWRGTTDAYSIWVSEIMLQQTRVAAVIEHYQEFLRRFPSLLSLALAEEAEVLAAWSGLGYYRRARMLHKAAQFIVQEREGRLPASSSELRTLPGIGEYTAAAIASIAFGEPVAVVDGNVERVILRLAGRGVEATAAERTFVRTQAQALVPDPAVQPLQSDSQAPSQPHWRPRGGGVWSARDRLALKASAHPTEPVGGGESFGPASRNTAGDHNQAMMELGATICLPHTPQCVTCPVVAMCRTRGEHATRPRAPQRSEPIACLLDVRKRGTITEVLLSLRGKGSSIMPAMLELPALPLQAVEGREPALRVRHSITHTNYYVQVFAPWRNEAAGGRSMAPQLRKAIMKGSGELHWAGVSRLGGLPITGLTRKILQRLHVMECARMNVLE